MKQQALNKILEKHKHWIDEDCDGWERLKANLSGADLFGANLSGANLSGATLSGADLISANLSGANLYCADLYGANLRGANLSGADLSGADLRGADLSGADLRSAKLSGADLYDADLSGANLSGADLYGANLRSADLYGANLYGANLLSARLYGADLRGANNIPFFPFACPETGSFIAYKKASGYIVKLQIPEDAKRLSATSRKCRCDKAQVLEIQNLDGTTADLTEIRSDRDKNFIYEVGKTVSVDSFDENRWNECSTGIHFFINRQEAVEY